MFCSKCGSKNSLDTNYCTSCGSRITNDSNNLNNKQPISQQPLYLQPTNNNRQYSYNQNLKINNGNNKMYLIGGFAVIAIIAVIFSIFSVLSNNKVYFNSDSYSDDNQEILSGGSTKTSNYETIIVHDRTYEGVTISTTSDAKKLIADDSNNQKSKCPKDIIEIENRIIKNYNTSAVNLCEMDKNFALEIENVIKTIYNDFPTARGYLTNMSLANVSMSEGYVAAFMPVFPFATTKEQDKQAIKTQILLNTSYFLNLPRIEAAVKDSSNSGHFPPNTNRYSPVAHEFGHYLSFIAMMKSYNLTSPIIMDTYNEDLFYKILYDFRDGDFSIKMITEAYNNYKSKTNTTMSLLEFRSSISSYAVAKDKDGNYIYDETIAEAFHDYYLNSENSKDASKEVVAVLKKYVGGI